MRRQLERDVLDFERLIHEDDALGSDYLRCTNDICALHRWQLEVRIRELSRLREMLRWLATALESEERIARAQGERRAARLLVLALKARRALGGGDQQDGPAQ